MHTAITVCRACGSSNLSTVFDLGEMHVNAFPKPDEPDTPKATLTLCLCADCSLVQLRHTVDADSLFRTFWYRSDITQSMRDALADVVEAARRHVSVNPSDVVVDIGSNTGFLLDCYPKRHDLVRVGFEPAYALANESSERLPVGSLIVMDYFSASSMPTPRQAKVITACAMFYDVPTPGVFLADVRKCLTDDGIFICQLSYLPSMLATNDFMNICHEHVAFYSLTSLLPLFNAVGLCVYDVEQNAVNGGSIRVYASKNPRGVSRAVQDMLEEEKRLKIADKQTYVDFGERCWDTRHKTIALLQSLSSRGPIYLLSASTKGQILSQFYGFSRYWIQGASERDPHKVGREMVGSRIPIVSEEEGREKAKVFVSGLFYFRDELIQRERQWLADGGTLVFCQPKLTVVTANHLGTPTIAEV